MNFEELLKTLNEKVDYGFIVGNSIPTSIIIYTLTLLVIPALFAFALKKTDDGDVPPILASTVLLFIILNSMTFGIISEFNYGTLSDSKKEAYIQEYLNSEKNQTNKTIEKYDLTSDKIGISLKNGEYISLTSKKIQYDVKNDGIPYYSYVEIKEEIKGEKTYKKGKYNEIVHLSENAK